MITLYISHLFTNIPNNEVLDLIKVKLQEDAKWDPNIQKEVIERVNVTINKNYFQSNNRYWQQKSGTPMGLPISSTLDEIFLQNLENEFYPNITSTRNILYIARYVDDVLIVYDPATTKAEAILQDHNNMHPKMEI
jgi:hypothetical protein